MKAYHCAQCANVTEYMYTRIIYLLYIMYTARVATEFQSWLRWSERELGTKLPKSLGKLQRVSMAEHVTLHHQLHYWQTSSSAYYICRSYQVFFVNYIIYNRKQTMLGKNGHQMAITLTYMVNSVKHWETIIGCLLQACKDTDVTYTYTHATIAAQMWLEIVYTFPCDKLVSGPQTFLSLS